MARLELLLLGPLQVSRDGQPVTSLAYDKVRALLVYLAVEADRPHRREALADLLWPDQSEQAARHSLSQALTTLRQAIGDQHAAPPVLLLTRETVQFNHASDYWLDVTAFTALLNACDGHAHRRPATCSRCARRRSQAADLYRGSFLTGFSIADSAAFEEWVLLQREWLHQRALTAFIRLTEHLEHCGAYTEACAAARRLLALDPWHEEAHRQLMRVLARSGQRGTALAQYERCRRILADDLGLEPDAATVALSERIRTGAELSPPPAVHPRADTPRQHLPVPPTPFVGRERELADLAALLTNPDCRLITLVGPGGIGKTRLAIQAAQQHRAPFADGVGFVPLAPLRSADQLVSAIADALAFSTYAPGDPAQPLLDYLSDQEVLLVLDNVEHLLDGVGLLVELLGRAPDVTVLVTSRERLNVPGEWVVDVGGLGVPASDVAAEVEAASAVRLFVQCARRVQAQFVLRAEDRPSVARLCRLVGGMPLALELAAAWVAVLPCDEIAHEIGRNLDFLAAPVRELPARHRSVRAVFDHSWRLLPEQERGVFRRLSVLRGGFERTAAAAVAGAGLRDLFALVDKSLLRWNAAGRYEIHELLRQYGEDKLRAHPDEHQQTGAAHSTYYATVLAGHEAALKGRDHQVALAEIGVERENVRTAWRWAAERGNAAALAQAADSLMLFYAGTGQAREGEALFGATVALLKHEAGLADVSPMQRDIALGKVLRGQGAFCMRLGRCEHATAVLDESIVLFRRRQAHREIALSLNMLAATMHLRGAYADEAQLLAESIRLGQAAGDDWIAAYSRNDLAMARYRLGEHREAQRLAQESLVIFRQCGDPRGMAFALHNLGVFVAHQGDYAAAEHLHRDSLALRQAGNDRWGSAASLTQLGVVVGALGNLDAAKAALVEALQAADEVRALPVVLDALVELAALLVAEGDHRQAGDLLVPALHHPACPPWTRERAARLLADLPPSPTPAARLPLEAASQVEALVVGLLRAALPTGWPPGSL